MKKAAFLLSAIFLVTAPIIANENSTETLSFPGGNLSETELFQSTKASGHLAVILETMYQLAQQDTALAQSKLANTIDSALRDFIEIEDRFYRGSFKDNDKVRTAFLDLSSMIVEIGNHVISTESLAGKLKPWHVRRLDKKIAKLANEALQSGSQSPTGIDGKAAVRIFHFEKKFTDGILKHCQEHIGAGWEQFVDTYGNQTLEFVLDNKKVTVPILLGLGMFGYNLSQYMGSPNGVDITNIPEDKEPTGFFSKLWHKYHGSILVPIAAILFGSFESRDGYIRNAKTGLPVNRPVQSFFEKGTVANATTGDDEDIIREIKGSQYNRGNGTQYRIISIDGLNQKSKRHTLNYDLVKDKCGFYAIYHLMCLRQHYHHGASLDALSNREAFDTRCKEWQEALKIHRVKEFAANFREELGRVMNRRNVNENLLPDRIVFNIHNQWCAENADYIKNHNTYEIFAKWCRDMAANRNIGNFAQALQIAENALCLYPLIYKIRDKATKTMEKTKQSDATIRAAVNTFAIACGHVIYRDRGITKTFEDLFKDWQEVDVLRGVKVKNIYAAPPKHLLTPQDRRTYLCNRLLNTWPTTEEIMWLITNHVPELCQPNFREIDGRAEPDGMRFCDDVAIFSKSFPGHRIGNTLNFRNNGTRQFFLCMAESGANSPNANIKDLKLNWDKKTSLMAGNHYVAGTIGWANPHDPGNCPVEIALVDSYMGTDMRHVPFSHFIRKSLVEG